jgi:predicted amidohydrolase YtcJ
LARSGQGPDGLSSACYGRLYFDQATIGAFVSIVDKAGRLVHTHVIGDRAARTARARTFPATITPAAAEMTARRRLSAADRRKRTVGQLVCPKG